MIICGDALTELKKLDANSIDAIVTDPPYGLNYHTGGDLAHRHYAAFDGRPENIKENPILGDGEEADAVFESMLLEAARILKPGSCCCCCCGGGPKPLFAKWTLLMDKHLNFKQAVVWDKGGLGMGIHYRRNYEFMLVAFKSGAAVTWNGEHSTPNIYRCNKIIPRADQHPTVQPVELMKHFIRLHTNPGDTVLDPFMGSGTTGVAAISLSRSFIGIELNPKYVELAEKRISQVQMAMF